jgi:sacsin
VFDHRFLDCQVAELCSPPEGFSLAQIVVSKFLALQQAGCLSPSELTLQPTNCDALFSFFAASTHHIGISMSSSAALAYNSDELELLRSLPIYKTRRGVYVSVDPQLHCVVPPNVFLQPDDELCLQYQVPEEGGLLYSTLGIPELTDHEVMARFALPGFSAQTEREQERILAYLHMNWATMRQNEAVVSAMRATKFIRPGDGGVIDDGSTRSLTLFAPPDLLDPQNPLLKRVFSAEVAKFPSGQFATPGWLSILRVAGLRSVMDASLLLDCAVKVEELGQQSSQTSELGNAFDVSEVATDSGSVSTEVWTTAGMLMEALLSNFASVYGTNFCEALGRIAFVPAERGIPNVGGAAGGTRKVLAAYSEAVLLKDWPLAWTSAPILATSSVVPPDFSWGAFRLRSPPTFPTVLAHLEV